MNATSQSERDPGATSDLRDRIGEALEPVTVAASPAEVVAGRVSGADQGALVPSPAAFDALVDAVLPVVQAALAEQAEASCICTKGRSPADYDGPDRDCPMHGETLDDIRRRLAEQRQRAEKAEATLKAVRDLCNLTIAASCRAQAIEQAQDTLAVIAREESR